MSKDREQGRIWIGTSGWQYKHWKGRFYPLDLPNSEWLSYYCRYFDTIEVNTSFYRTPKDEAVEKWRRTTPRNFLFAVKGSRYITHNKKLKVDETSSAIFFDMVRHFGRKLGPILFQLPPSWHINAERLADFLAMLPKRHRVAFEFRHESWLNEEIYAMLRKYKAGFCLYHLNYFQTPFIVTSDFVYIRLHGPGAKYKGSYKDDALTAWADRIRAWQAEGRDIYCYFDNDEEGYAAFNAVRLKEILGLILSEQRHATSG